MDGTFDWASAGIRPGQWVCPDHGPVAPWQQVVPACRDCLRAVHLATATKSGGLIYVARRPATCAGPQQHRLSSGTVLLGWSSCLCSAAGGHQTWTCRACGDVQSWPPHSDVDSPPR